MTSIFVIGLSIYVDVQGATYIGMLKLRTKAVCPSRPAQPRSLEVTKITSHRQYDAGKGRDFAIQRLCTRFQVRLFQLIPAWESVNKRVEINIQCSIKIFDILVLGCTMLVMLCFFVSVHMEQRGRIEEYDFLTEHQYETSDEVRDSTPNGAQIPRHLFLSNADCKSVLKSKTELAGHGVVKQVWFSELQGQQIVIKEVLPGNGDEKDGHPFLPRMKIFRESAIYYGLESQYGEHAVHFHGLCYDGDNTFSVVERLKVCDRQCLHSVRHEAWAALTRRLCFFHGGPLEGRDIDFTQFAIKNGEVHMFDLDDIVKGNSIEECVKNTVHEINRFQGRNPILLELHFPEYA